MVLVVPLESSSTPLFQWKYDVFLSFRGDDTRKNFTNHLYATLHRKGVYAFKDDKQLKRGKHISLGLLQAIQDSRFSIVIFSKNYAHSTWCLYELETIFECMKQGTLTAIPIFYGVDPSDVQMLIGEYGKAFAKHADDYKDNLDKVMKWRVAMTEVANLSGWDLQNRHEVEFIEDIVDGLMGQLRTMGSKFSEDEEGIIRIDNHLMQLERLFLQGSSNDVSIIGICGMGGVGKTTIARVLYSRMSNQFELRTFLANVRETSEKYGLVRLQEQLLSEVIHENNLRIWDIFGGSDEIKNRLRHRKAFIILDDVDNIEQLKSLAAKSDWFGAGTIIIITTRNEHLLSHYKSFQVYKVVELDWVDALKLFCLKAFKRQSPKEGYENLSHSFVEYCKGLPLAIDVIGSFLNGRSIDEWDSALNRLKQIPNKNILDKLHISFDGLEEIEQQIFLDIACFFKGEDQHRVKRILESYDLYPDIGIRVLIDKSLISISSSNEILMHDLLQDMGREIIRRQSPEEPGKRSRLWLYKDVCQVLSNNTGTKNVEAIMIEESCKEGKWSDDEVLVLSNEVFSKLKRLRLLKLPSPNISCGSVALPNTLRYLYWYKYPCKSLPCAFHPNQLVELHLCDSKLQQLWKEMKPLMMLRILDLSGSEDLILTPNFIEMPNVEIINLEGCIKLSEVHKSIGLLDNLVCLNLKDCRSLTTLPSSIYDMKSLETLVLHGCSFLKILPEQIKQLAHLKILDLGGVGKREVSIAKPWEFLLPWRKQITSLSLALLLSLSNLRSLTHLSLKDCHLQHIPLDFGCFPSLVGLDLSGNDFLSVPSGINRLSKLNWLLLCYCKNLQALPEYPSSIETIRVDGCTSLRAPALIFQDKRAMRSRRTIAINCFKMVENKKDFVLECLVILFQFVVTHISQAENLSKFCMIIPGGDIPEWFTYKTFDDRLVVPLPPNWCNDKFIGGAVCYILGSDVECGYSDECKFLVKYDGNPISFWIRAVNLVTDHLCLFFSPLFCEKKKKGVDWFNDIRMIEVSCESRWKTKMLGLRVVYEQDVEELMQYTAPSCQDDFYGDGEGPSEGDVESSSSSMELEISSKRLKTAYDD